MRHLSFISPRARLFNRVHARRNALAQAVREAGGLFRERVKPSARRYRRHARHRLRSLAELMV